MEKLVIKQNEIMHNFNVVIFVFMGIYIFKFLTKITAIKTSDVESNRIASHENKSINELNTSLSPYMPLHKQ